MIDFRLLGPLEAAANGVPLELPAGKPSALLARLLLDAGRVVPVEALVDGLWGDRPPASARKVLQVYVSQLRKALGPERIETRPPGYVLHVAPDELDLARFEALADAAAQTGEPARRAELLHEALSLWRGPGLAEFRDEPFAHAATRRLADLRLSALERRIEADLDLGRHEAVIRELERVVEEEPLREQLRRQLMLALYRSGRQADALAQYRDARTTLVRELGIEPSRALQELEVAILRQDPALERVRPRSLRGCIVCGGAPLADLFAPLTGDGRELVLVELAHTAGELADVSTRLDIARQKLERGGTTIRTACFTSDAPHDDLARLAAEQDAELLVVGGIVAPEAPCDVALVPRPDLRFEPDSPVLVPFGGRRAEWAALEFGAWVARAHGLPLHLLGTEASEGRRDASRLLANASLALQRFAAIVADTVLVPPGARGILTQRASLIVASLPPGRLDPTRRELVERSDAPVVFVRAGLRPSGLAPDRTLTRFSWSLGE